MATPAIAALSMVATARGATVYWDIDGVTPEAGGATPAGTWDAINTFWNVQADGAGAVGAWAAGDTAVFSAGTTATGAFQVDVSGTQSVGGLSFEEGTVTLAGGTLDLVPTATADVATGVTGIVNSIISGVDGLTKTGDGTLTLGGVNTFTGTVNVNGGVLSIGANAALGNAANSISLNNSTLQITGPIGVSATPNTRNIALTTNGTIRSTAGNATFHTGVISGSGTLTKSGAVSFVLGTANTYTGNTIITEGTLVSVGINSLGATTNSVILNGGTLRLSANYNETRPLSLAVDSQLDASNPSTTIATYSGVISGAGKLTKIGAGTMILNATNTYTGATAVTGGILQFNTAGAVGGTGQSVEVVAGGTVALGYTLDQSFFDGRVNPVSTGTVAFNNVDSATNLDMSAQPTVHIGAVGNVTYSGTITPHATGGYRLGGGGGTLTVTNPLTGSFGFTKSHAGTVIAPAVNTFVGPITLAGGTLAIASDASLGDPSNNITLTAATTLRTDGAVTTARTLTGASTLTKTGTSTLTMSGDNLAAGYSGTIIVSAGKLVPTSGNVFGTVGTSSASTVQVANGAQLEVGDGITVADRVFVSGTGLASDGVIRKVGTGATTFTGGITLNTSSTIIANAGTLTFATGSFFNSTNPGEEDLTLGGAGNIIFTGSPTNANIATAGGKVIKEGSGNLSLSSSSTYTGGTVIRGGYVIIGSVSTVPNSLGTAPTVLDPDNVLLDGGGLRQTNGTSAGSFLQANRGIQMTANGGTVDYTATAGFVSIYSSAITAAPGVVTSTLTKTGNADFGYAGGTAVGNTKLNTGFTQLVVLGGFFRLRNAGDNTELGYGREPVGFDADAILLNGGGIGTAFSTTLSINRGITIGANGGIIDPGSSSITIPADITGAGKLTIRGGGGTILNSATNVTAFTGALEVNGFLWLNTSLNAHTLTGTSGTIRLDPTATLNLGSSGVDSTYAGIVQNDGTTAGIVNKLGTGTLTLSPASEWTNNGNVNINAGTLRFGTSTMGFSNDTR
ncbi:MAG: autotransporter-associated beta strand repeat-containing protein, partial [Tepidisphaeraceae bacterium]